MTAPLHALVRGPQEAPVVVLLHSIATAAALWEPQLTVLAERFRVVALDLPGHGQSPALPAGATIDDYAQAVLATLDGLAVGKAAFVGLSFGSSIAQVIAAKAPQRVLALVLAAGTPFAAPPASTLWRERAQAARASGMAGQADAIIARWFTAQFLGGAPLSVDRIRRMVLATSSDGYAAAAEAIAGLDNRSLLPKIACPTLVLAGEHDQAVPRAALDSIVAAVPGSQLRTVAAAHLFSIEAATEVTEVIGAFLLASITD